MEPKEQRLLTGIMTNYVSRIDVQKRVDKVKQEKNEIKMEV